MGSKAEKSPQMGTGFPEGIVICPVARYIYVSVPYSMWHTKCLAVIAGSNLCCGDNTNNGVLASDEMIFIGRTSSCV